MLKLTLEQLREKNVQKIDVFLINNDKLFNCGFYSKRLLLKNPALYILSWAFYISKRLRFFESQTQISKIRTLSLPNLLAVLSQTAWRHEFFETKTMGPFKWLEMGATPRFLIPGRKGGIFMDTERAGYK